MRNSLVLPHPWPSRKGQFYIYGTPEDLSWRTREAAEDAQGEDIATMWTMNINQSKIVPSPRAFNEGTVRAKMVNGLPLTEEEQAWIDARIAARRQNNK